MNWSQARRKLLKLARRPPGGSGHPEAVRDPSSVAQARVAMASNGSVREAPRKAAHERFEPGGESQAPRAASLTVASGKGGTGKSVVTASLASLFATRGRTLIVDADMGVGNAHILQDVSPPHTFVDVVDGNLTVREAVFACGRQVDLLAAGSGVPRMSELSNYEMHLIANGLEQLERQYSHFLIDSAAGVSRQTLSFAAVSDVVLVVTTPDLTALTDAYAFLKVLHARQPECGPLLLINRVGSEEEAHEATQRIERVCERFLGAAPRAIGWLPDDPLVSACVNRRGPVVRLEPQARFSGALRRVAVTVLAELRRRQSNGFGSNLQREVGFSRPFA